MDRKKFWETEKENIGDNMCARERKHVNQQSESSDIVIEFTE